MPRSGDPIIPAGVTFMTCDDGYAVGLRGMSANRRLADQGRRQQMDRFRADNTDGYTQADLDELNRLFRAECRKQGLILENDDMWTRSAADNVAEHVQAAYDTARHA